MVANENFISRTIYIKVAFLQARGLDHEVFLKSPKDVKRDGKIWLPKKSLDGLNGTSRKFWLKVREVFEETGMKILPGGEGF